MGGFVSHLPIVLVSRVGSGVGLSVHAAESSQGLIRDMLNDRGTSGGHDQHIAFLKALRAEIPTIIQELEDDWNKVET